MKLSEKFKDIKPSAAVELDRLLMKMKDAGEDFISFNAGQPDFDTPQNIKDACIRALADGKTKYTSINGISRLREAICEKLKNDNNVLYDPGQIVVTTGAKQALYNCLQVLLDKNDEVIVLTPCWVSYTQMIKLAGGIPVHVPTDENFRPDLKALKNAVSPKTKGIIINTPCNPTGVVFTEQELREIADLAVEKDLFIISDEVYEKLVYDGSTHFCPASISEEVKNRCIIVNGFSKAYSMTGWRIGYLAAPLHIADAVCTLQSHSTSNSTTFVQWAAVEALTGPQDSVEKMKKEFDSRRRYVCNELKEINGIKTLMPQGAFYIFPDVSHFFGMKTPDGETVSDSVSLCTLLLKKEKVAILPGEAFGQPGCVRIAYSNSPENLKNGIKKIKFFLSELK